MLQLLIDPFSVAHAVMQNWRDNKREERERRQAGLESLLFAEEMLFHTGNIDQMQLLKYREMQRIQDEHLRNQRLDELMQWIESNKHSSRVW